MESVQLISSSWSLSTLVVDDGKSFWPVVVVVVVGDCSGGISGVMNGFCRTGQGCMAVGVRGFAGERAIGVIRCPNELADEAREPDT